MVRLNETLPNFAVAFTKVQITRLTPSPMKLLRMMRGGAITLDLSVVRVFAGFRNGGLGWYAKLVSKIGLPIDFGGDTTAISERRRRPRAFADRWQRPRVDHCDALRVLLRTAWLGRGKRYSIAELRPADAPSIVAVHTSASCVALTVAARKNAGWLIETVVPLKPRSVALRSASHQCVPITTMARVEGFQYI